MDDLARIQATFLAGQQLMLQAFNELFRMATKPPRATTLGLTLSEPVPKEAHGTADG
jgi:hypothetical protein